jgi:DNA polymerase III delta prime subunit
MREMKMTPSEEKWFKHATWAERYRPKTLDDFVSGAVSEKHWSFIRKIRAATTMKSLLFCGPAGGGKTTLGQVLVNHGDYPHLHLNGSLVGKQKILEIDDYILHESWSGRQKVVLIDESDGITPDAQQAMRAMTEKRPSVAWVLTCNEKRKLIPPLLSRLYPIEVRFPAELSPSVEASIHHRCKQILVAEQVSVKDKDITEIIKANYPDVRSIINTLQIEFEPIKPNEHEPTRMRIAGPDMLGPGSVPL